mgnify:FL=1
MKRDATHGIPFSSGNCHYFSHKQYFVIAPVIDQEGKRTSEFHIFITGSFSSTADIHSMITAVTAAAFVPFSSSSSFDFLQYRIYIYILSAIPEKSALLENILSSPRLESMSFRMTVVSKSSFGILHCTSSYSG